MSTAVIFAMFKALVVLSILILIIGMIRPKWVFFWMKEPNRILVSGIALIMFMTGVTGYSQFTVHPKPKSERESTQDETNAINLGRTVK
ncbi:MAG: hypothetical protein NTX45_26340 [Proteobacteria bacterium]|nr:hypothetical protein [Pseudomonadota bacterium]